MTDTEIWWLTQIPPPERANKTTLSGMHRLSALKKSGRGPTTLALWLRRGNSVLEAEYPNQLEFDNLETLVISPEREQVEHDLSIVEGGLELTLNGLHEGFYNAYLIGKKFEGETLIVSTIQSELINHSCRNGHKHVSRNLGPFYGGNGIPLEIVRNRVRWEDFHSVIKSGDVIEYQLLLYGEPASGVKVTMTSHQGWQKSKVTNSDGKVSFEFIGEYFGKDKEFHSRDMYHYLLTAEYSILESGEFMENSYQGIKYKSTVSEKYRAATEIYTSTIWALFTMLITMTIIGLGVFIYRRKTSSNYREIIFDE